jgi:hypothetical protein
MQPSGSNLHLPAKSCGKLKKRLPNPSNKLPKSSSSGISGSTLNTKMGAATMKIQIYNDGVFIIKINVIKQVVQEVDEVDEESDSSYPTIKKNSLVFMRSGHFGAFCKVLN